MTLYERLEALAYNLRWDWKPEVRKVFRALDPDLWQRLRQNPVALLRRLEPAAVNEREELEADVDALYRELESYLEGRDTWYEERGDGDRPLVAYFSAEFGITECLPIYSGGLGVLAGDHLKSASDLGIPLVGLGLLYREGYFRQGLDEEGGQTESFPAANFDDLPVRPVERDDGSPVRVTVPFPGRPLHARVWRAQVGRVPVYLLDTDVDGNRPEDRRITARLYGGGQEMRIEQELLLGIGGYRVLRELGAEPRTFHMNEGHSAFLALELVRDLMQRDDLSFEDAAAAARARSVFTTHTPVPAGHDRFPRPLVARYLTPVAHGLGLDMDELMDLGREEPGSRDPFTMTVLALRFAEQANGVSELHGAVSREMWQHLWPDRSTDDVPIGHITNGIHAPSWVHPAVAAEAGLDLDRLGIDAGAPDPEPAALWRVREERRRALVEYVYRAVGASLNPEALTIAFARRFATYKRATLLLSDPDRLAGILGHTERPVQILFAGKAHPKDQGGKALIRRIGELSRDPRFRDRIVFLPDYAIDVGRHLVQGADVWLNNPRRPMEASGTSGMKAAMNGVLNVSILDGWWDEAWRERIEDAPAPGWAIGEELGAASSDAESSNAGGSEAAGSGADSEAADRADTEALFRVLEDEVIPTFYDRDDGGVPRAWLARVRESIRQVAPVFNTHRMLVDYADLYRKAAERQGAGSGRR